MVGDHYTRPWLQRLLRIILQIIRILMEHLLDVKSRERLDLGMESGRGVQLGGHCDVLLVGIKEMFQIQF